MPAVAVCVFLAENHLRTLVGSVTYSRRSSVLHRVLSEGEKNTHLVEALQQVLYSSLNLLLGQRSRGGVVADTHGVGGLHRGGDSGEPGNSHGTDSGRANGAGRAEDSRSEHCVYVGMSGGGVELVVGGRWI